MSLTNAVAEIERTPTVAGSQRFDALGIPPPILGVGLLQAVLVSFTFPIRELSTERPILHIDAAYHWYQMAMARAF